MLPKNIIQKKKESKKLLLFFLKETCVTIFSPTYVEFAQVTVRFLSGDHSCLSVMAVKPRLELR